MGLVFINFGSYNCRTYCIPDPQETQIRKVLSDLDITHGGHNPGRDWNCEQCSHCFCLQSIEFTNESAVRPLLGLWSNCLNGVHGFHKDSGDTVVPLGKDSLQELFIFYNIICDGAISMCIGTWMRILLYTVSCYV